ncbi:hypothetical protein A6R68_11576, partial [Neotoma lepida]
MDEKTRVRSTEVKPLTKSAIITIASLTGKESQGNDLPGQTQTRAYRRSLKVALDVLGKGTRLFQGGRTGGRRTSTAAPKVLKEQASSSPPQRLHHQRRNQKGQKLFHRSPGKRGRPGPVLMGSQKEPAVQAGKARAHTAVGPAHFQVQGKVLQSTRVWPGSCKTPAGNASDNPGKRKLSTSKLRSLRALASREGARNKNEQQATSRPPRHASTSPKALKQVWCGSLKIRPIRAQRKTTLPENKKDPGRGILKPYSKGASAAFMPPIPRLRRSLRIASQKRKIHELCAQCWLPELENQMRSKVSKTRVKRRAAGVQKDHQATNVASAQEPNTIKRGMLVWFKFQDLPFWPAVVKSINKNDKMARVLLMEGSMQFEYRGHSSEQLDGKREVIPKCSLSSKQEFCTKSPTSFIYQLRVHQENQDPSTIQGFEARVPMHPRSPIPRAAEQQHTEVLAGTQKSFRLMAVLYQATDCRAESISPPRQAWLPQDIQACTSCVAMVIALGYSKPPGLPMGAGHIAKDK